MTNTATKPRATLRHAARRIQRGYAGEQDRPLGGYAMIIDAYTAMLGALTTVGRARGARLPDKFGGGDH